MIPFPLPPAGRKYTKMYKTKVNVETKNWI